MNNVVMLNGQPFSPVIEAPMDEWVEPIRRPITIRIAQPERPEPTMSDWVKGAACLIVSFLVGWTVLS